MVYNETRNSENAVVIPILRGIDTYLYPEGQIFLQVIPILRGIDTFLSL